MGNAFHRCIVILLLSLMGLQLGGIGAAHATGGFDVPKVDDQFNQFEQGPPPSQEPPAAPQTEEDGGWFDNLTKPIADAWDSTVDAVSDAWDATVDAVSNAWDTAIEGISDAWDATVDALASAWDWTVDKASAAWEWLTEILEPITNFVIGNVEFVIGAVTLAIAGLALLIPGRPGANQLLNWGKSLIGVDNRHPHGTLKDVQTNDQTLAHASQLVYFDKIPNGLVQLKLGKEWTVVSEKDLPHGFQGKVFVNDTTNEIIIAFRGTETDTPDKWNDYIIGDGPIAFGNDTLNLQAISARKYVEEFINNPKYKGYQFVLTGHSLGGYLALDSGAQYRIPTVTFNAPGKNLYPNVNASILFGPKASAIMYGVNMLDPNTRKQAINERLGNYDQLIRNYEYNHDLVGELGYRPGESYHIDDKGNVTKDEALDNDLLKANINVESTHGIKYFTAEEQGKKVQTPITYDEKGNIVPR